MSELTRDVSEDSSRSSFLKRLATGLMIGAYEQMGMSPERAAQVYEEEKQKPASEIPITATVSPAAIARAARAYDPDKLARGFRGNFKQH